MLHLGLQANADGCHCRAVSKESQNRYSKSAKDWGWREFLQLHTLFDQEAGFLVSDSVVFAAEVCNHVGPAGSSVVHLPDVEHR